jgi:hypothetical protein
MNESDIPKTLAVKYARIIDDRQYEQMAEIMTEDFSQEGPGFKSSSLAEFIAGLPMIERYSATFHLVGNQCGEWHNDIYTGETWSVASHIYAKDGVRYQDVIENAGGIARYISRDLHVVWTQDLPCQG